MTQMMRSPISLDVALRHAAIGAQNFETIFLGLLALGMRPVRSLEMSGTDHKGTQRQIPEERIAYVHTCVSTTISFNTSRDK
jgi:hypothetical protein